LLLNQFAEPVAGGNGGCGLIGGFWSIHTFLLFAPCLSLPFGATRLHSRCPSNCTGFPSCRTQDNRARRSLPPFCGEDGAFPVFPVRESIAAPNQAVQRMTPERQGCNRESWAASSLTFRVGQHYHGHEIVRLLQPRERR
jgi:hypothetical protein